MRTRVCLFALCIGLLCLSCTSEQPHPSAPPSSALSRGIAWLLSRQTPEGTFRCLPSMYRSADPARAAEVLFCLSRCPQGSVPQDPVDRAVAYLRAHIAPDGMVENSVATAQAVSALVAFKGTEDPDVKKMVHALLSRQACEANGHAQSDPDYGGWELGDRVFGPHPDRDWIRWTAEVVEALAAAKVAEEDTAWERALTFVARRQLSDGGFTDSSHRESSVEGTLAGIRILTACDADCAASGAWLDARDYEHNQRPMENQWEYIHVQRLRGKQVEAGWLEKSIPQDFAEPSGSSSDSNDLGDVAWAVAALAEAAAEPSGK